MTPEDYLAYLPFDISIEEVTLFFAGLSAILAITVAGLPFVESQHVGKRMKKMRDHRSQMANAATRVQRRGLNDKAQGVIGRFVQNNPLFKFNQSDAIRMKLAGAGIRSKDALIIFLFCKFALPVSFGAIGFLLLIVLNAYNLEFNTNLLITLGSVALGFYAPNIYIKNETDKRKIVLLRSIPDALDLMVICAESGLNIDAAMARVAREIRSSEPELADEFELTSIELGFMSDRRKALNNLAKRTQIPSVEALTSTLIQAEKYGTPLADTLRVLAAEMRDERMLKAEEKAARLPATLTVPMIIFILPPLFVVLIGPGILSAMDSLSNL